MKIRWRKESINIWNMITGVWSKNTEMNQSINIGSPTCVLYKLKLKRFISQTLSFNSSQNTLRLSVAMNIWREHRRLPGPELQRKKQKTFLYSFKNALCTDGDTQESKVHTVSLQSSLLYLLVFFTFFI